MKDFFEQISKLDTEQQNQETKNIDFMSTEEILKSINDQDKLVPLAVEKELPYIEKAVELIITAFQKNGRLIYFGAGTSGRLGVVDASECPPTFGTNPEMVQGFIAGGKEAMFKAQEGAEDSIELGYADVEKLNVNSNDVVCGIAASNRTPYVIGAVKRAKELGAKTLFITCSKRENFNAENIDVAICPYVGPEVVMGSTRMKSGTAQKLILNMLTTTAMIRLGKTYENMMIDLQQTNKKLVERSKRILIKITNCDYETAGKYLELSNGHVKSAIIMIMQNCSLDSAKQKLEQANGFVRKALEL